MTVAATALNTPPLPVALPSTDPANPVAPVLGSNDFASLFSHTGGSSTPDAQTGGTDQGNPAAGFALPTPSGAPQQTTATTAPAVPPPPPRVVPVVEQVVPALSRLGADAGGRVTITLAPAALGRVEVQLDVSKEGRVQAVLTADNPQTLQLLQRDAAALTTGLQDAGLNADSSNLAFNLRGDNADARDARRRAAATPVETESGIDSTELIIAQRYRVGLVDVNA